jgi:hypothetical protein
MESSSPNGVRACLVAGAIEILDSLLLQLLLELLLELLLLQVEAEPSSSK